VSSTHGSHGLSFPIITSSGNAVDYPSPKTKGLVRTYASFNEEPIHELRKHDNNNWALNLSVPVPSDLYNPTLKSLVYIIKYGSTWDNGDSTVQADVAVTADSLAEGIVFDSQGLGIHRRAIAYGPRLIDEEKALPLSSVPGIKGNAGSAQWSHYVDHQRFSPNVRFVQSSNLYLTFQVHEYSTDKTLRSLAVEVAATWLDDLKAREEAERKAREEAERKAAEEERLRKEKEEAERKAKEAADKKLKDELEATVKAEVERRVAEAEKKLKDELAKSAAPPRPATPPAPTSLPEADHQTQATLNAKAKKLGRECPNGWPWRKNEAKQEWRCLVNNGNFGSHYITFAELNN